MALAEDIAVVEASIAAAKAGNNAQRITLATMVDSNQYVLWRAPEWFVALGGNVAATEWTDAALLPRNATLWQAPIYDTDIENDDETLPDGNPDEGDDGNGAPDRIVRVSAEGAVSDVISRRIYEPVKLILDPEQHEQTRGTGANAVKYKARTLRMPNMIYSRAIQYYLSNSPAAVAINQFVYGRTKYPILLGVDIATLGTLKSRTQERTIRVETA